MWNVNHFLNLFSDFASNSFTSRLDRSPDPKMRNHTPVVSFILLGLTDDLQMQILIFTLLFITYILSIAGNLIIITLILEDSHLKSAMYYFLQNFSFLEISFTSVCTPRFLYSISTGDRSITYNACVAQLFFTYVFGMTEFFLLATMSYDHYVAICKPLHYMTIMNHSSAKCLSSPAGWPLSWSYFHHFAWDWTWSSVTLSLITSSVMFIHSWRSHAQIHGSLRRWPLFALCWSLSWLSYVWFCPTCLSSEQF